MAAVGEARGKLLLFGEHAAVYGNPAVGVSLAEKTIVRLEEAGGPGWNLDMVRWQDRETVAGVLARMVPRLNGPSFRNDRAVRIDSTIPRSVGFGSSAALCVALARALIRNMEEDPHAVDGDRVWELAHDAEHLFHGRPSGVDTGISMIGGLCILTPTPGGLPTYASVPRTGLCLVAGAVPRSESCGALINGLAERMKRGEHAVQSGIGKLAEITRHAARLLTVGGPDRARYMGALAEAAMDTLRSLGLSTPELELVLDAARRAGARGAKLSGGGGGGAFYAVAPEPAAAPVIARAIEAITAREGIPLPGPLRVLLI